METGTGESAPKGIISGNLNETREAEGMAEMAAWLREYSDVLQSIGIIGGLVFSGLGLRKDAQARRAETLIEVTRQHRELWTHYENTPELADLFDQERDLKSKALTEREARFVDFVANHIRATFYARAAGIYVQPQRLKEDVRSLFSYPAVRAAWQISKQYHDDKFVAFIEKALVAD